MVNRSLFWKRSCFKQVTWQRHNKTFFQFLSSHSTKLTYGETVKTDVKFEQDEIYTILNEFQSKQ